VGDVGSYGLIFLDLVLGVAVLWVAIWCAVWAIKRVRRSIAPVTADSLGRLKKRRCETCGSSWWSTPGRELSQAGLQIRRAVRKYRRGGKRRSWAWTSRQGWSRCPSCLSREVRDSADQEAAFIRQERRAARLSRAS
jgi:hypothetical protein